MVSLAAAKANSAASLLEISLDVFSLSSLRFSFSSKRSAIKDATWDLKSVIFVSATSTSFRSFVSKFIFSCNSAFLAISSDLCSLDRVCKYDFSSFKIPNSIFNVSRLFPNCDSSVCCSSSSIFCEEIVSLKTDCTIINIDRINIKISSIAVIASTNPGHIFAVNRSPLLLVSIINPCCHSLPNQLSPY